MAAPGSTIRLRTLGALQLHDGGGEEARALLAQPRRIALLVYLTVAAPGGFVRRDRLLALFWPDHDDPRGRNALSQALHFLRRALGSEAILSHADDEIGVAGERIWCDVLALEAACAAGRWDEAVELYRGPFLDGVHVSTAAPELERWIADERSQASRRHAQALERLAAARTAAGDHAGAAVWLRRLAAHDPLDARTALALMRALAAAGDHAGAIGHARVHEALVREELGAAASPEVAALVRELQAAPPPLPLAERMHPPLAVPDVGVPASHPQRPRSARRRAVAVAAIAFAALGVVIAWRARRAAPPIHCLAVIPLENLTRDSSQEYFADGVTDAIITELARHERLTVISRSSTMRYKRTSTPVPAIGRALGCDGVIEGTVSIAGSKVHLNAQLLYAPEDRHLWAMGYDGDLTDVLGLERTIADSIASQIHSLTTVVAPTPARRVDPIAYGQYLRGRDAFRSRSPTSLRQAVALFQQAITRDSTFALGYAGLADAYRLLAAQGATRAQLADSARLMARRALGIDSTLSEAHTSLAALLTDDTEWESAEAEYRRAISLSPGNALAHQWYATLLATVGRKPEALAEIHRAAELDPLSQALRGAMTDIERWAGVRDTQIVLTDGSGLLDPTNPGTVAMLAVNLARRGRCDDAYAENRRARELAPYATTVMISLAAVHQLCNHPAEARSVIDSVERRPDASAAGLNIAELFARKEPDSSFAWLDRTEWRMSTRFQLRVSPHLAPLRGDPRYAALLARQRMR